MSENDNTQFMFQTVHGLLTPLSSIPTTSNTPNESGRRLVENSPQYKTDVPRTPLQSQSRLSRLLFSDATDP